MADVLPSNLLASTADLTKDAGLFAHEHSAGFIGRHMTLCKSGTPIFTVRFSKQDTANSGRSEKEINRNAVRCQTRVTKLKAPSDGPPSSRSPNCKAQAGSFARLRASCTSAKEIIGGAVMAAPSSLASLAFSKLFFRSAFLSYTWHLASSDLGFRALALLLSTV